MAILNLNFFIMFYILFNNLSQVFKDFKLGIVAQKDLQNISKDVLQYHYNCTNVIAELNFKLIETNKIIQIEQDTEINLQNHTQKNNIICNALGKYILQKGTRLDLCYAEFLELPKECYKEVKIIDATEIDILDVVATMVEGQEETKQIEVENSQEQEQTESEQVEKQENEEEQNQDKQESLNKEQEEESVQEDIVEETKPRRKRNLAN